MKSNLAQEIGKEQGKLVKFPKKATTMSEDLEQGFVMSSRLYRKEVYPFLSDAARNVYTELENRITGHNKKSDFVSYSQLQGGALPGSRKLSSKTVSNGIKELIELGVISVIASGKQGVKSYQIHEVSLVDHFTRESALSNPSPKESTLLGKVDHFTTESETTLLGKDTIDINRNYRNKEEEARASFQPSPCSLLQFTEYHNSDFQKRTLKELTTVYPVSSDFMAQAKSSFPNLTEEQIQTELKKLGRWSLTADARSAQKWMTTWMNWLDKLVLPTGEAKPKHATQKPQAPKTRRFGKLGQTQDNPMRDIQGEATHV